MSDSTHLTDEAILQGLGERLSRFRLDRNLTQADLATEAGVHRNTIFRLEAGGSTQLKNLVRVLRVLGLQDRLEALVPEPVPSPLRQLEELERRRKRAVSKAEQDAGDAPKAEWSWEDDDQRDAEGGSHPDNDHADDQHPGSGS